MRTAALTDNRGSCVLGRRELLASAVCAPLVRGQEPEGKKTLAGLHVEQRARTIALRPDDITIIPAFHAALTGNLQPPPQPRPSLNGDFCVKGFVQPSDTMTWTVRAPQDGEYRIAILYNGNDELVVAGCTVECQLISLRVSHAIAGGRPGYHRT